MYIYIYTLESSCALRVHLILLSWSMIWALPASYNRQHDDTPKRIWNLCIPLLSPYYLPRVNKMTITNKPS